MVTKSHHHGNLREALITAGQDLLQEGGVEALTLRQCAIRAGVSHAAPAHHFDGIIGLKTAIITRGYRLFSQFMLDAKANAEPDPDSQLLAICHGYLEFAHHHRAMFNLIFAPRNEVPPPLDDLTLQEFAEESHISYQILSDACAPFLGGAATETMVWSLVHGYATLFGNQPSNKLGHKIPPFEAIFRSLQLKRA